MKQYNSLNVNLSNSQPNKLKSAIKNETEVLLRLSSNTIGDNETNFPHKLLLTLFSMGRIKVGISPQNIVTFSFNPYPTLV